MSFSNKSWLLILLLSLPALAVAQSFSGKPFLAVQGRAEARVKPDVFPIEITLAETSMDSAAAGERIEKLAQGILASAEELKVGEADLDVGNLSISPETKWNSDDDKEIFLGNTYEREIKLKFHSLVDLRAFIAKLPDSKFVQADTQTFEFSGADELKRKLRRDAIEDAKKGAQEMAAAVGKRLIDLHNVSDRQQTAVYSSSGYASGTTLDAVMVQGSVIGRRASNIVLREGEIRISAEAYLVYVIGD
ncbi:MAG: hypothetical protein A3E01_16155 [Gammaproteobacteria bacterium RIFCSPHIGHO2_12_FULL_63_22]|nr:MAG: hypothetical protein A3E01_16155 [Gammaproteobacteria bacterium RIFCSPHIGHO2_12_FULL_63_22]